MERKHLINIHTSDNDSAVISKISGTSLHLGEIAVQHTSENPGLWIKVGNSESSNNYEKIIGKSEVANLISSATSSSGNIGDISQYWKNIEDSAITINNVVDMLNYNMQCVINNFYKKPVTIWETDGTWGFLGVNDGTMDLNSWQLGNLDFSPYKFVIAYIKQADRDFSTVQANYVTPAMMICIPLDEASKSSEYNAYIAGGNTTNPNDRNVQFCVIVAIDETKTKFKVVSEHSIYGTALGGRNDNGRYCYKLEGYY